MSLIEEDGTIQEVKEAARHKGITTTAKYMKAHEEKLKALLERRAARVRTSGQLQGSVAVRLSVPRAGDRVSGLRQSELL